MSDPAANRTLELACTVGAVDDAAEALDDGADIDFGGGAPLFLAIYNKNREILNLLVDRGADLGQFLPAPKVKRLAGDRDALLEALLACGPKEEGVDEDPAKLAEFAAELKANGLEQPILKGDWDGIIAFRETLESIGAKSTEACVSGFLALVEPARDFGEEAISEMIDANADAIGRLNEQLRAAEEDLEALAKAAKEEAGEEDGAPEKKRRGRPRKKKMTNDEIPKE